MTNTDDRDLHALREFRSALDDPPEGVLVRGRYRLASNEYRPPSRRRQWLLSAAGAAAALAVVVGVAATVNGTAPAKEGGQAPAVRPSTQSPGPSKAADLPVTFGTGAPQDAPAGSDGGATHAKAVAAMNRLAEAAANAQPMQVGAGQVLYIKTYNLSSKPDEKSIHELWMDPQTKVALRIRRTDAETIDSVSTQEEIDQAAAQPADMYRPTAQFLASLPADPAQLIATLRQWAQTQYPNRNADGMVWKDAFELINYSEPFWTPQQRTAIYQALTLMPDLKATTAKIDNKPYDLVCMDTEPSGAGTVDCTLFDSATGHHAGSAWPQKNLSLNTGNVALVDYGTQPRPTPDVRPSAPVGQKSHTPK